MSYPTSSSAVKSLDPGIVDIRTKPDYEFWTWTTSHQSLGASIDFYIRSGTSLVLRICLKIMAILEQSIEDAVTSVENQLLIDSRILKSLRD